MRELHDGEQYFFAPPTIEALVLFLATAGGRAKRERPTTTAA